MKPNNPSEMQSDIEFASLSRRAFLHRGALLMSAGALSGPGVARAWAAEQADSAAPALRIGLVTDIHHADKPEAINRFYRESLAKLGEGVARFNELKADFVVELGDFIDAADSIEDELSFLKAVEAEYARFQGERHYVLGNHCVWLLSKEEFLANSGAKAEFYSFDRGDFHFVILDACYRADGVAYHRRNFQWTDTDIPPAQRDWLKGDLARANKPTIVFVHQRLDVENNYGVKNAHAVRQILEDSGNVLAVFQGHSHRNEHREIGGVHYCALAALVEGSGEENSAYSVLAIHPGGALRVEGFRRQRNYHLVTREAAG
jgi:hypothetical protein